jgi:hypothetical protein
MNSTYEKIKEGVDQIALIDTHEHLIEESERLKSDLDFSMLLHQYARDDLESAGMPHDDVEYLITEGGELEKKWRLLAPWWEAVKHTDYLRAYRKSMQINYGIDDLDAETCVELTRCIREANQPGILKKLIRDGARVERCIVNSVLPIEMIRRDTDEEIFSHDLGLGWVFCSNELFPRDMLASESGLPLRSFADLLKIVDWYIDSFSSKAVSIKIQSAYSRTLLFEETSRSEADRAFDRFLCDWEKCPLADTLAFQNVLMRHICRRASEVNLPVRLHTGYLAGVGPMNLPDVNPALLCSLLNEFPETRFALFHIGYPFTGETLALAKRFPNVTIDMCWAWLLDSRASREFLQRFVAAVPVNKLFAFGGDYIHADLVAGHASIAREGVAHALADLIDEGMLTESEATGVARKILRENAIEYFGF